MIPRTLEPEVMDSPEEARDYDSMDHREVNRIFVDDFLRAFSDVVTDFGGSNRLNLHDRTRPLEVLDVGTGTAQIPIELCRRPFLCRITAIDLARHMLAVAKENVARAGLQGRIRLACVDAKRMPYPDRSFGAVISNSIVHHIPEPKIVLAEMLRVVQPGGLMFVRDLMRPDDLAAVDHLVATYAGDANDHQRQMFRESLHAALTIDEIREILAELGLSPDDIAPTSDRHWTMIARKET